MITAHATAADFSRWAELAQGMDTAALIYTVRDCSRAAAAMGGWNPNREGFYRDQAATYQQELDRRAQLLLALAVVAGEQTGTGATAGPRHRLRFSQSQPPDHGPHLPQRSRTP